MENPLHHVSLVENNPLTGEDVLFETGKPVKFRHMRNPKPSPNFTNQFIPMADGPKKDPYMQGIEPHGRYLLHGTNEPDTTWESGLTEFRNPLVLSFTTDSNAVYGPGNWKARLSQAFGGKKGKVLSKAIAQAGYDGVITVWTQNGQPSHTKEIVDLRMFHNPIKAWLRQNCRFALRA